MHFQIYLFKKFLFSKTVPKLAYEETQKSTIGHTQALKLPVLTRWFSNWTLINSIKSNEVCLKSSIWSAKITDNVEIKKKPDRLKKLQKLLCDDIDFWSNLGLVEELLRPLKTAILTIEGSSVDVQKSYKVVDSAFEKASKVASKFSIEQKESINQVNKSLLIVANFILFLDFERPT